MTEEKYKPVHCKKEKGINKNQDIFLPELVV